MMSKFEEIFRENAGPPVVVEAIIRSLGIELDKKASLDQGISGQIEVMPDGNYKISANKEDNYFRRRFTMAHELGHFLYHAHLIGKGVDDNRAYRSTQSGPFRNTKIGPTQESQANRFAAALLMPKDSVRESWGKVGNVQDMAAKFQVSKQAMEIRLRGLGLLDL